MPGPSLGFRAMRESLQSDPPAPPPPVWRAYPPEWYCSKCGVLIGPLAAETIQAAPYCLEDIFGW